MTVDVINAIGQESILVISSLVTLVGVLTTMIVAIGNSRRGMRIEQTNQRIEKQTNGNLTAHVARNAQLTAALANAGIAIPPPDVNDNHVQLPGGTMELPSSPEGPVT